MGRCADLLFKVKKGGSNKLSVCVCRMLNNKRLETYAGNTERA